MIAKSRFAVNGVEYIFEIEEKGELDTLNKIVTLANPPKYCQLCDNTKYFKLDSNKDKEGNIYVNMCCLASNCYAKAKLGSYKAGGFFWHRFERYEGARPQNTIEEADGLDSIVEAMPTDKDLKGAK